MNSLEFLTKGLGKNPIKSSKQESKKLTRKTYNKFACNYFDIVPNTKYTIVIRSGAYMTTQSHQIQDRLSW